MHWWHEKKIQVDSRGSRISKEHQEPADAILIPAGAFELSAQGPFGALFLDGVDSRLAQYGELRSPLPIQVLSCSLSITASNRQEDRMPAARKITSEYCANLVMTFRSTNPALAGRGAADNWMDERADVEQRGSRSLTPL
jgi:hypothetical protein